MSQKLFVLGLPGSGKSTVARYIIDYLRRYDDNCSVTRLCDYDILQTMFHEDTAGKNFHCTEHNGFYVINHSIYDAALCKLERKIKDCNFSEKEIVLIEFARSDYMHALKNFSQIFLQDSYFLFLNVDIEIGMKRVRDRVEHPTYEDDHFVSKYTFEFYRQRDSTEYLSSVAQQLTNESGIKAYKIKILNNRGPERDFCEPVNDVIAQILADVHAYA